MAPTYTLAEPAQRLQMHVKASTKQIRPFVVCAVLRGMKFDDKVYKSFIDLQDKLHQVIFNDSAFECLFPIDNNKHKNFFRTFAVVEN